MVLASFLALPSIAHAGAWVTGITMTRTPVGSDYDVTVTVTVRTGGAPPFGGGTITTCMHVQEEDICFDDDIFNGPVTIAVPPSGTTSTTTLGPFRYPCSWGSEIEVTIENITGFTGRSEQAVLPRSMQSDECGPGVLVGQLELTPEVLSNSALLAFFTSEDPQPRIPATNSVEGGSGAELLGFTTRALLDPRQLGYEFYELHVSGLFPGTVVREVRAAGPNVNAGEPTVFSRYGPPVNMVSFFMQDAPIDFVRLAEIFMVDAEQPLQRIRVFSGSIGSPVPVGPPPNSPTPTAAWFRSSPNPFTSEAAIHYDLAQAGPTRIRVFDSAGRMLREFQDVAANAGARSVVWDGRDGNGSLQPSGTYFYEIQTARERDRGRMTLIR